jgi:hypothetical protein
MNAASGLLVIAEFHFDRLGIASLAETGGNGAGEFELLLVELRAFDQCQWTPVADGFDGLELPPVATQVAGLTFLARNDQFKVAVWTNVAADLEQHDIVEFVFAPTAVVPQILLFDRITTIGQKATASSGLRVIFKTEFSGQRHLWFACATVKILELLTVHPAFQFRTRWRQVFGA